MYKFFVRPLFFLFDPETIHHFSFRLLAIGSYIPLLRPLLRSLYSKKYPALQKEILGLTFPSPVGLAAGFDKDALVVDELSDLGFGFIEIGTVTPKPQPGNEKPRLFRLPKDKGIINRMGFNNKGVKAAAERLRKRLRKRKSDVIIGGNIGKNKVTPNDEAVNDYLACFDELYDVVDYFVVNVSSPNTPNLRELQDKEPLKALLERIQERNDTKPARKPVLLKIAPDLTESQIDDIVEIAQEINLDGLIATNTTISRDGLQTKKEDVEEIGPGGLSGKPVFDRSTEVIRYLREKLGPSFPIIGVGGIMKPEDALRKLEAGATLIQIYTGFIYEGPGFVNRINKFLSEKAR
ncbi:MAG: quinone-dependent dihydroorotate dehydrogenase [Cyclobacteriaceae bacterium]